MILILVALVVGIVGVVLLFRYADTNYNASGTFAAVAGCFLAAVTCVCALAYCAFGYSWFASEYKARIINREYGTNYTKEEVFWASDVINTIRELDRKRVEVNGDLLRDKKDAEK